MLIELRGQSADEIWQDARLRLISQGSHSTTDSRLGYTDELLHVVFSIEDPRQRWVFSRRPAINPAFALAEVVWIVSGRNDSQFLNYFNPKLENFAGKGESYHGAYGYRLRRHFDIDQLERAYNALSSNPKSRQVALLIWDPRIDLPQADGAPSDEDIPCNLLSMLKVRDRKLHWMQIMRSNDLFLGLPHNFVQFTYLHEIMAGWLGLELGPYLQISDSLHLYEKDLKNVKKSEKVEFSKNTHHLNLNKSDSESLFSEIARRVDLFVAERLTQKEHHELAETFEGPPAFHNILRILAADSARRRDWTEVATNIIKSCTDDVLVRLWSCWLARILKKNPKM